MKFVTVAVVCPDEDWCNYSRVQWRESVSTVLQIPLHTENEKKKNNVGNTCHLQLATIELKIKDIL